MEYPIYQSPTPQNPDCHFEKDFAHDLPEPLLVAGWRKFWSKRENREYYYNKNSGASLWDLSELQNQEGKGQIVSANLIKRKSGDSSSYDDSSTFNKRQFKGQFSNEPPIGPSFIPGSLYNFSYPSYLPLIKGKRPLISVFLPPHPLIEFERASLLSKLRSQFANSCVTREGIQPPEGSFNRWLMQMKLTDSGSDPVFPSKCVKEIGSSMKRELLLSLPFPISKAKYLSAAKTQLIRYAESVKDLVERRNASPPCRKIIKHNVDDTLRWIRNDEYHTFDDFVEKLVNLKRVCQPHIQELIRESVEKICIKMFNLSQEYSTTLRSKHLKLIEQLGIQIPELILKDNSLEHVVETPYNDPLQLEVNKLCPKANEDQQVELLPPHALGLACQCPLFTIPNSQPPVTIFEESMPEMKQNMIAVQLPDLVKFHITKAHYEKLDMLYTLNSKEDLNKVAFKARLWCLLQRYYSYLGCESGSFVGAINQAALPIAVFETLHRLFDVNFEMFASPLNCYFSKYCSAFHDTDQYFGSCGPALEFFPITGSFEANPPFCEELLLGFVHHIERLLQHSDLPLSFIVFIPDWRDPPFEALTLLEASSFNRHQISLRAREHEYRILNFPPQFPSIKNTQGFYDPEVLKRSGHNTLIVFMQNDAGFKRWTPTSERLTELINIYYTSSFTSNIRNRRDLDEEYVNSVS